jgi:hypothetical protein
MSVLGDRVSRQRRSGAPIHLKSETPLFLSHQVADQGLDPLTYSDIDGYIPPPNTPSL